MAEVKEDGFFRQIFYYLILGKEEVQKFKLNDYRT